MKTRVSRLRRHLTYANVMASVAVFLALGGVSYAAATINGNTIVNYSIGAGKLKKRTLGSNQVKKNGLTGAVIDESTLSIVPRAQAATTAATATTASTATSAATAQTAAVAAAAETLGGMTSAELLVRCPEGTALYGGMCWDEEPRAAAGWIAASEKCGEAGGRLPTLSELIAYFAQPGEQFGEAAWSGDVSEFSGSVPVIAVAEESGQLQVGAGVGHGYRCVFHQVN